MDNVQNLSHNCDHILSSGSFTQLNKVKCLLQLLGLKDSNTLVTLQTSDRSSHLENVSPGQFLVVADPVQLAALQVCK